MREKREAAGRKAETRRQEMAARVADEERRNVQTQARAAAQEVVPWLQALGFSADEARRAAARCETAIDASLEQRVRLALTCFGPRTSLRGRVAPALAPRGA